MGNLDSASIIREIRMQSGLSQAELAEKAGTSQPAVARYETGASHPSTATLQRIAAAAGFEIRVEIKKAHRRDLSGNRAKKLRENRGEIKKILNSIGACEPRIFGSVSRGTDNPQSDIDLLVDFDCTAGLLPIAEVNRKLSKLLREKVEVSPMEILKKDVLRSALKDAIPL